VPSGDEKPVHTVSESRRPLHDEPARPSPAGSRRPASGGCFADEIAIDFPSMRAVVERMRDGMLGHEAASSAQLAEISVSRREAHQGVTVPLELTLRDTCSSCGGRGETWEERCGRCQGSGECRIPHHFSLSLPPGVVDGTRFQFIVGAGHALPTRVEVTVLVA